MKAWFYRQNRRDQLALLVGALVLAGGLLWQGLLVPLADAAAQAGQRRQAAQASLVRVQTMAQRLQQLQEDSQNPRSGTGSESLVSLVDGMAARAGLSLSSLEAAAEAGEVSLRIDESALPQVLEWLHTLEQSGLIIDSLSLVPGRQQGMAVTNLRVRRP